MKESLNDNDNIDIKTFKEDFKMFCDKAASLLKEDEYNSAIRFYIKAKICIEKLIEFDENKYNEPVYKNKKKELEKKIDELRQKELDEIISDEEFDTSSPKNDKPEEYDTNNIDINTCKKDFKMFCDKAASVLKDDDYKSAIEFYIQAKICLEKLIEFDENKYNKPVYENTKKNVEKKIDILRQKELKAMTPDDLRNKVKEFSTSAVKYDKLEEYDKALDFYNNTIERIKKIKK